MSFEASPETRTIRTGVGSESMHGDVMPPLHLSSTFTFRGFGEPRTFDYTRSGNPTRATLESAIAELESGAGAVVTSSGMSAVAVALHMTPPGGVVVAPIDCYGGTHRLLSAWHARGTLDVRWVDFREAGAYERALSEGADLVWIETPSNPLLRITDIRWATALARSAGALSVVDNTFLSPALQQPIRLGADAVVHSTTKYINGHSDVVGGAVVAASEEVAEEAAWWANAMGVTGAPFDSYLTLRGLRTLHARIRQHEANARAVVEFLAEHPSVRHVHHPGLVSHPDHRIACGQQDGFGAVVSFELAGHDDVEAFLEHLGLFSLAESLGGVESLVCHPASMTHASMSVESQRRAGIGAGLLRLSVGIEDVADLIDDLARALGRVAEGSGVAVTS